MKENQINIRVTNDMKEKIKETGYTTSEYGRMAIEKQLTDIPINLQIEEKILKYELEQLETLKKEFEDKIHKTKKELKQVQIKISKCETLSKKIKTTNTENKEAIEEVLVTVRNMIQKHNDDERYYENKTTLILHQNNLNFFAKKTGLKKDELIEIFKRENLDLKIDKK